MNNVAKLARVLLNTWGKKTFEELRVEAERETRGIALESIRADRGPRLMVILCATDLDQIALLGTKLDLVGDGATEDWNRVTLAELALRIMRNGGKRFRGREFISKPAGRRTVLSMIFSGQRY